MSADSLAALALSPQGKFYAVVCDRYGRDPAAWLEGFDEVLAHDFRTALLLTRDKPEEPEVTDGAGIVTDLEAQMRELERRMR